MNDIELVVLELTELKKLGVRVTKKALAYPAANPAEIAEYIENGMSHSDIADLVRDLASL